jgi:Flp pilus assembly protein TadD
VGSDEEARRKRARERLTGRLQAVSASRPARPATATASAPRPAPRAEHAPTDAVAALHRSLADSAARGERKRAPTLETAVQAAVERAAVGATASDDNPELEARQAEHAERWGEAARAWARASDARPDVEALARRAALNFLKDGHQLSRGVEYAQRAVQLSPQDAFTHRVLGQIYLEARMWQNARSALEQALALNPADAAVHVLIQKARRQG